MSDDLISREDTKQAIRHKFKTLAERCEINEVLNSMPSVQPKTGRWTLERVSYLIEYVCTNCKASFPTITIEDKFYSKLNCANMNFCPNCGAKMEDNENE